MKRRARINYKGIRLGSLRCTCGRTARASGEIFKKPTLERISVRVENGRAVLSAMAVITNACIECDQPLAVAEVLLRWKSPMASRFKTGCRPKVTPLSILRYKNPKAMDDSGRRVRMFYGVRLNFRITCSCKHHRLVAQTANDVPRFSMTVVRTGLASARVWLVRCGRSGNAVGHHTRTLEAFKLYRRHMAKCGCEAVCLPEVIKIKKPIHIKGAYDENADSASEPSRAHD